jgi:saccharopine dehydrogenase-like NADP-dependent oxidoreductase
MITGANGKKVLLLGAGMVARPGMVYLLDQGCEVLVADLHVDKAEAMVSGYERGSACLLDIADAKALGQLVAAADLTISLLPAPLHPQVAEACIDAGKPLVTTSYVSPAMEALAPRAQEAGVLLLNEIGMDPGIDHMSAMKIIHAVRADGGRVVSFRSYCGGLPAPEANDNPWGYKFSWRPQSLLTAGLSPARYLDHGEVTDVSGPNLFLHHWSVNIDSLQRFEGYPNRDSMAYIQTYGLKSVQTMLRGTLRNPGWCDCLKLVVDLGLLDQTPRSDLRGQSHAGLLASLVEGAKPETLRADIAARFGIPPAIDALERLEWAGFFSDEPVGDVDNLLDMVSERLTPKLAYSEGERDMIVLRHELIAEAADGQRTRIFSTLVDFGVPGGDSAMARTVSLPCAAAALLVLEGKIDLRGLHIPVSPEIYEPVLAALENQGILCKESVEQM